MYLLCTTVFDSLSNLRYLQQHRNVTIPKNSWFSSDFDETHHQRYSKETLHELESSYIPFYGKKPGMLDH